MTKGEPEIRLSEDAVDALRVAQALQKSTLGHNARNHHRFRYGWCRTDHKSGRNIRHEYRKHDYLFDEPYASRVAAMLDRMGLPMPDRRDVFRGTRHDLLFLNSHGVVLRIGPSDIADMINPGVLQPLGWLQDDASQIKNSCRELPLTVAIYPGVEIYDHFVARGMRNTTYGSVWRTLRDTGQLSDDIHGEGNTGIVSINDEQGEEQAVRLVIDTDNEFIGTEDTQTAQRQRDMARIAALVEKTGFGNDAVLGATLGGLFNTVAMPWHYAQAAHQPLRSLFWRAFDSQHLDSATVDVAARNSFWHACAVAARKSVQLPTTVWRMDKSEDGAMTLGCREIIAEVRLYKPWTGYSFDRPGFGMGVRSDDFFLLLRTALRAAGYLAYDAVKFVKDKFAPTPPASARAPSSSRHS